MLLKEGAEAEGRRSAACMGEPEPTHGVPPSSSTGVVLTYAEWNDDASAQTIYQRLLHRHHTLACEKEATAASEAEAALAAEEAASAGAAGGGASDAAGASASAAAGSKRPRDRKAAEPSGAKAKPGGGERGGRSSAASSASSKAPASAGGRPGKGAANGASRGEKLLPSAGESGGSGGGGGGEGGGGGGEGGGSGSGAAPAASDASAMPGPSSVGGAGGSSVGGAAARADAEGVELPPGWVVEQVGGRPRYTGPDGTQVSTATKAMAWHRKQMQLEERYAKEHQAKRRRAEAAAGAPSDAPPLGAQPAAETSPAAAPAAAAAAAGASSVVAAAPSAAGASTAAPAPPPKRSAMPEYGLSMVEIEAVALSPSKAAGKPPGRKLPRELRNLAMPDRDWNVAMPCVERHQPTPPSCLPPPLRFPTHRPCPWPPRPSCAPPPPALASPLHAQIRAHEDLTLVFASLPPRLLAFSPLSPPSSFFWRVYVRSFFTTAAKTRDQLHEVFSSSDEAHHAGAEPAQEEPKGSADAATGSGGAPGSSEGGAGGHNTCSQAVGAAAEQA